MKIKNPISILNLMMRLTMTSCAAVSAVSLASAAEPAAAKLNVSELAQWGQTPPAPLNLKGPGTWTFTPPADGRALRLMGRLSAEKATWKLTLGDGKAPGSKFILTAADPQAAFLTVNRQKYFIKPDLDFYVHTNLSTKFSLKLAEKSAFEDRNRVMATYPQLPSVYQHVFTIHLERGIQGLSIWLDGRFMATIPAETAIASGTIQLGADAELAGALESPALGQGLYLPLDLDSYARPGPFKFQEFSSEIHAGSINSLHGIPFLATAASNNIDVGLSRWLQEKIDLATYCDGDTTRSAFDGLPESIVLRVPKANYIAAHVLCTVEPDTNKVPALSLRVTRFGKNYGDGGGRADTCIADTTVYLPAAGGNAPPPTGLRQVGTVASGKDKLPVYSITVPLKMGTITDMLGENAPAIGREKDFFDIELTREIRLAVQFFNLQNCRLKPLGMPSAVHVFGVTLERNPIDVQVTSKEAGHIFYAAENPSLQVSFSNRQESPAKLALNWEVTDFYGKTSSHSQKVEVPAKGTNGGLAEAQIPLSQFKFGHHDAVIRVTDDAGRELWREPTSFALLPPDTRKAGAESPFGIWWFQGTHGTCDRVDLMGSILLKMGMRHCTPQNKVHEAEMAPYKLTPSMTRWAKTVKDDIKLEQFCKENPSVRFGMVFHETQFPDIKIPFEELLGKPKPEFSEEGKKAMEKLWPQAEYRAQWFRDKQPNLKISFGNTSSALMVAFMRQGWPKKYVDCFAMEGVANWHPTEMQPRRGAMQEVWYLSEMRKFYGYEDVPVSSGYEYIDRCTAPGALTEREQADYYVRDVLHCLAYGYPSINVGLAEDVSDSYYATLYGSSGVLHRYPLLTPKPSYVAYATLTRVLDGAKYSRYFDTGSRGLYILEFARGAEQVYPVWTTLGTREVSIEVAGGNGIEIVDAMGNASKLPVKNGVALFQATTTPAYIITSGKVTKVSLGKATYADQAPVDAITVGDFNDPPAWEVETKPDTYLETYASDQPAVQGKFTLTAVQDEEKGKVAELTMEAQPEVPKIVPRYVSLKLKQPNPLASDVARIGMWVKGNSCWGRVYWEFTDARGESYFSASDETSGWDVSDWKGRTAINFDGWRFVSLDIPKRYPGGFHGPTDRDWSYNGGDQDGIVQHPITLTRVVVALRDSQVYVTDMVPSQNRSIRLGSILAGK